MLPVVREASANLLFIRLGRHAGTLALPALGISVHPLPKKHYTDLDSQLSTIEDVETYVLCIRGSGFVTREMVGATVQKIVGAGDHDGVLVDLRDVAGYEQGCAHIAQQWLLDPNRGGIRRVAFVASSSVLRTATHLVSDRFGVALRTFDDTDGARCWLAASRPEPDVAPSVLSPS